MPRPCEAMPGSNRLRLLYLNELDSAGPGDSPGRFPLSGVLYVVPTMSEHLGSIQSPADIKSMSIAELTELAQEIRELLISSLSKTGGHLGPNLGVVELTLAMHYVFDTPVDRFLFDVSHQTYVHKLLTGRAERFHTIRQPGGLNGFMLRTESEHDAYGAGHAGTALSAALGMAVARDLAGTRENIVAVAGDAAFTNGISFEALNNIGDSTKRLICRAER